MTFHNHIFSDYTQLQAHFGMFVFLSHADKDKDNPQLRTIVQMLINEEIKVWLDKPYKLGYSLQSIDKCFLRLHAGGRWEDEIDEAKREAACILVCWSKHAEGDDALKHHFVWFSEADYGRAEGKLVSCRIDEVNPALLPGGFGQQHIPDMRDAKARAATVEDIRGVMDGFTRRRLASRRAEDKRRSLMIPYLVNRDDQEHPLEGAIKTVHDLGGIWPFFIAGPENECVDEFVERLKEYTSWRCLGDKQGWEHLEIEWGKDDALAPFAQTLMRRLGSELSLFGRASISEIAAALNKRGRPVAIVSRLIAADWRLTEDEFVRTWLRLWHELDAEPGHRAVVPLLVVKMPRARTGWSGVPTGGWFSGVGQKNKVIWDTINKISNELNGAKFTLPPILRPVHRGEVDSWVSKHFSLSDNDRLSVLKLIEKLFRPTAHERYGVPHADFVDAVFPLFRGAK